jgi:hypothetical protein
VFRVGLPNVHLDKVSSGEYYFTLYENEEDVVIRVYGAMLASYFTSLRLRAKIVFNEGMENSVVGMSFFLRIYK